jgi:hypothetical protein
MRTLIIGLMIIVVILVFVFSALAQGSPPSDLFLAYADLLTKDQTRSVVDSKNVSCEFALFEVSRICSFVPDDGIFSDIWVTMVSDAPKGIAFQVIEGAVRVGDLAALWGKPDSISSYYLRWDEPNGETIGALVASADRLDYFAPVQIVTFTF